MTPLNGIPPSAVIAIGILLLACIVIIVIKGDDE